MSIKYLGTCILGFFAFTAQHQCYAEELNHINAANLSCASYSCGESSIHSSIGVDLVGDSVFGVNTALRISKNSAFYTHYRLSSFGKELNNEEISIGFSALSIFPPFGEHLSLSHQFRYRVYSNESELGILFKNSKKFSVSFAAAVFLDLLEIGNTKLVLGSEYDIALFKRSVDYNSSMNMILGVRQSF